MDPTPVGPPTGRLIVLKQRQPSASVRCPLLPLLPRAAACYSGHACLRALQLAADATECYSVLKQLLCAVAGYGVLQRAAVWLPLL
jgi:hypothetical protein